MADTLDLTFGEVGPEHFGMHLAAVMPAAPRADAVLTGIRPCNGPEYVALICRAAPLGVEVPISISRLRTDPVRLHRGPVPDPSPTAAGR